MKTFIQQKDNDKTYQLTKRVGSGLLGIVYQAKGINHDQTVAVKIPAPNLFQSQLENFYAESKVVSKFHPAWREKFPSYVAPLPQMVEGHNVETNQEVLIIEFVPDETKLQHYLNLNSGKTKGGLLEREMVALSAATQYLRALQVLHQIGYTSADRKIGDLHWFAEHQRLVVLDWNATRSVNQDDSRAIIEDLKTFGLLWYQMLTGRYAQHATIPLQDPAFLAEDRRITLGTLEILHECIYSGDNFINLASSQSTLDGPQAQTTFPFKLVEQLILKWGKRLDEIRQNPTKVYQELSRQLQNVRENNELGQSQFGSMLEGSNRAEKLPDLPLNQERELLKGLDVYRFHLLEGQISDLEINYNQAWNLVKNQGYRLVSRIASLYSAGGFSFVDKEIAGLLQQADRLTNEDVQLRLHIARWRLLVQATKDHLAEGKRLSKNRSEVAKILQDLEEATQFQPDDQINWSQLEASLQRQKQTISEAGIKSNAFTDFFAILFQEVAWRKRNEEWRQLKKLGSFEKAKVALETLNGELNNYPKPENTSIDTYIICLRNTLAFRGFSQEVQDLARAIKLQLIARAIKQEVSEELRFATPYLLARVEDVLPDLEGSELDQDQLQKQIHQTKLLAKANLLYWQGSLRGDEWNKWVESIQTVGQILKHYQPDILLKKDIDQILKNHLNQVKTMYGWGWVDKPLALAQELNVVIAIYQQTFAS